MSWKHPNIDAGPLAKRVEHTLKQLEQDRIVERLLQRDHTVWGPEPDEIANRLGWLDSPRVMMDEISAMQAFVSQAREAGFTHALLLGMGGSSLAPEVFRQVFGVADRFNDVRVLNSTDPAAVLAAFAASAPSTTLYIPATKSGGTVETLSFLKAAYRRAAADLGRDPGDHFVAITDPGSGLADLAQELSFRHIFLNDPDIGGRYSALSMFGLVPAALCGIDVGVLLVSAQQALEELAELTVQTPSVVMGALLGAAAREGRDKLTLVSSSTLNPIGVWVEQLVAESTGKRERGILPVDGEALGTPDVYGDDRIFVASQLSSESMEQQPLATLGKAGHPVAHFELQTKNDLGAELIGWEIATIIAGHVLEINPFDQPDVESAKIQARSMVSTYQETGELPSEQATLTDQGITIMGDVAGSTLLDVLQQILRSASPSTSYYALQAYLPPSETTHTALQHLRHGIRSATRRATTAGYGPRFLHSTGQLHKGDGGTGFFVQLTCDDTIDLGIPDSTETDESSMSFGVLKAAQALGDAQALRQGGRQVVRFHLGTQIDAALRTLCTTLDQAIQQPTATE